jgi:23S rRNA (cytosine1962-C5)-methyltransferase
MNSRIKLKHNREKSLRLRHPWVFAGALEEKDNSLEPGATVDVESESGEWLARGSYNANSQIAIRIWTWKKEQEVDAGFFYRRLSQCFQQREVLRQRTDAIRIVNAENDGLPGLIVDQYGEYLIVQFLSAGADYWRRTIVDILKQREGIQGVFERSDVDVREKEGLEKKSGNLYGSEPPSEIVIREDGLFFGVDVRAGHKTGFYLDQRENRFLFGKIVNSQNRELRILNAFSYTGAFSIVAKRHSCAHLVQVDTSASALCLARRNYELNAISQADDEFLELDVFQALRTFRDTNQKFDFVILDPPKFAFSKYDLPKAARAYKDINWLAMRLLKPQGLLLTFSCSGLVSETFFQQIVFSAAMDAGRNMSILGRMEQASDHPVRLTFPEGSYLKGFILQAE